MYRHMFAQLSDFFLRVQNGTARTETWYSEPASYAGTAVKVDEAEVVLVRYFTSIGFSNMI